MVQLLFSYHQFDLANAEPHLHAVMKINLCEIFTRFIIQRIAVSL